MSPFLFLFLSYVWIWFHNICSHSPCSHHSKPLNFINPVFFSFQILIWKLFPVPNVVLPQRGEQVNMTQILNQSYHKTFYPHEKYFIIFIYKTYIKNNKKWYNTLLLVSSFFCFCSVFCDLETKSFVMMLLMKDHLCSVLLSAWLLVLFLLVLVYVAGSWSKSLRRIFWMICFCDNRVMAKRTTLLTIVFRVNNEKYPSAERRSSASVLHTHDWINAFQCGPPGILSVMSSCLYGTSRPCEGILSACPLPVVAVAWLHFLMHLDRAQISWFRFVVVNTSYGFCFSRCSLRVLLSCLFLCSRRLDSDLLARVLSAWFSFSFHLICDAYAMQSLAW